jgi:hypothetical protein
MCKVAVRSTFTPGIVTVTATAGGLAQGTTTFTTVPVPPTPTVSILGPVKSRALPSQATVQIIMTGRALRYFLNVPAMLSFDILNAGGRVVSHIENFKQTEGWHPLSMSNLGGNGVYFVRCSVVQGKTFEKRVIVLK